MNLSPDLRRLRSRLRPWKGPGDDPVPPSGFVSAAVALITRPGADATEILLIRRGHLDGDPWAGHMALPGGRREDQDRSLMETAIRETWEETGVRLDSVGTMLGRLEAATPASARLPPLIVTPFVFAVPPGTRALCHSPEVAEVWWIPLPELAAPASVTIHPPPGEEKAAGFPAVPLRGQLVWGLTYRILLDFLARSR